MAEPCWALALLTHIPGVWEFGDTLHSGLKTHIDVTAVDQINMCTIVYSL